jgi:membrane-bound ClpP family serine protease
MKLEHSIIFIVFMSILLWHLYHVDIKKSSRSDILVLESNDRIVLWVKHRPKYAFINFGILHKLLNNLDKNKDLNIHMETIGGASDDCIKVCREIKGWKGNTKIYVRTYAFSCGTILAFSSDQIYMSENSTLSAINPINAIYDKGYKFNILKFLPDDLDKRYRDQIISCFNEKYDGMSIDMIMKYMYDDVKSHNTYCGH